MTSIRKRDRYVAALLGTMALLTSPANLLNLLPAEANPSQIKITYNPPNRGAPGNRKPGATRDLCPAIADKPPLTALTPARHFGYTISERPVFWFYLPYTSQSSLPVSFELRDQNKQTLFKSNLTLTNLPGIVSLKLPNQSPALQPNNVYEWRFTLHCSNNNSEQTVLFGWLKRVAISSDQQQQYKTMPPKDRFRYAAANGWWYDALTGLATLRHQDRNNEELAIAWSTLLGLEKLDNLASEPLVSQYCSDKR